MQPITQLGIGLGRECDILGRKRDGDQQCE